MNHKTITFLSIITLFLSSINTIQAQAWTQKGIDIDGEANDDRAGNAVDISSDGSTIIVGAKWNDGTANLAGHARAYSWNGTTWIQKGNDLDGEAAFDRFGTAVSINSNGNTVAIGASQNSQSALYSNEGHVRIFSWSGTAWVQKGNDIDGEAPYDESGSAIGLSADGNTVVIGASGNDAVANNAGHARIFAWNGTTWVQKGSDIDGLTSSDLAGTSVSISADGDRVAISSTGDDTNGSNAGQVRIFSWSGTAWVQMGSGISGDAIDDELGWSSKISADGNTIIAGSRYNDGNGNNAGQAQIHTWNGLAWVQKGNDIGGESAGDYSGQSVGINTDGNSVIIGAYWNDGNGTWSGQARIYVWDGTGWTQRGNDIDGEAANDQSGTSVASSGDGHLVIIGAPDNDGAANNAGHARVYSYPITGLLKNLNKHKLTVHPNPTNSLIYINLGALTEDVDISIINALGQTIQHKNYQQVQNINLAIEAPTGIYFLKIQEKNSPVTVIKVQKQ